MERCAGHSENEIDSLVALVNQTRDNIPGSFFPRSLNHSLQLPEGYEKLGGGKDRIAIGLCQEHVLKVEPFPAHSNEGEVFIWQNASDKLREKLCPVVDYQIDEKTSWLIMQRCNKKKLVPCKVEEEMRKVIPWSSDFHHNNIGNLNDRWVALDYGGNDDEERNRAVSFLATQSKGFALDF
jgi:hypothetical protein